MRTLVQCSLLSLFAACFNPAWAVQAVPLAPQITPTHNSLFPGLGPSSPAPMPNWERPNMNQIYTPGSMVHFNVSLPMNLVTEKAPNQGQQSKDPLPATKPSEPWRCCEVQQGHFENGMWQDGNLQIWDDLHHPGHDRAWSSFTFKGEKHIRARMYKTTGDRGSWTPFRVFSVIDNNPQSKAILSLISPLPGAAFAAGSTVHYQASLSVPALQVQSETGMICCEVQGMTFKPSGWVSAPITVWNDLLYGHEKTWNSFAEKGLKKIQIRLYHPNGPERSEWTPVVEYQVKVEDPQAAALMPKKK